MTSRQERRAHQRVAAKLGRTLIASGLSALPRRHELAAIAFVETRTFDDPQDPGRASAAARLAHELFEASLRSARPALALDCRKGCAHCCHSYVGATAPELFLIARSLGAWRGPGAAEQFDGVVARGQRTARLGIAERLGQKLPCALLIDGACSLYAARPTVCRKVTSTRVQDCIDELEGRALDRDITMSKVHIDHARSSRLTLHAALIASGLPTDAYELGAGLLRVLERAEAEARWLAGEPVFDGLVPTPAESTAFIAASRQLATDVTQLIG